MDRAYKQSWEKYLLKGRELWKGLATLTFAPQESWEKTRTKALNGIPRGKSRCYNLNQKRETALRKGKRFVNSLNENLFGRGYRDKQMGLITAFSVETRGKKGKPTVPHIHCLLEKHPSLNEDLIKKSWGKVAGGKAANLGVKVQLIPEDISVDEAVGYVVKYVTPTSSVELQGPKSSLRAALGEHV